MEIKRETTDDIVVYSIVGRMLGGEGADHLEEEVQRTLAVGYRKFVIDLGDVPWVDSIGLGVLIAARNAIMGSGGQLKLSRLSDQIAGTFTITGLDRIFDVYASDADARTSFAADAHSSNSATS
jgi:anti-sigma B factor antagonist